MRTFGYVRPADADDASARLRNGARAMGGGTDVLTQLDRDILPADEVVDLRALGLSGIAHDGEAVRIGATTSVADVERDAGIGERFTGLAQAAAAVGSPQLREMGTVGGNLCQQVRCWYFRHPDLQCWLRGGDTCYAQIGDHRKHGLEPGDCISVAPSDLAAALLAHGRPGRDDGPADAAGRPLPACDRRRALDAHAGAGRVPDGGGGAARPGRERIRDRRRAGRMELRARGRRGGKVRRQTSGWRRSACRTSPGRSIPATRRRGSPAWT